MKDVYIQVDGYAFKLTRTLVNTSGGPGMEVSFTVVPRPLQGNTEALIEACRAIAKAFI